MSETASASASEVLDADTETEESLTEDIEGFDGDALDADTETDEWLTESIESLDGDALDAVGIDLAVALLAGAVGVAAWDLPDGWMIVSTFALGGAAVMFAEDRRVRAVGSLILAGTVAPLVEWTAFAIMLAGGVATVVASVFHYDLVDLEEVI